MDGRFRQVRSVPLAEVSALEFTALLASHIRAASPATLETPPIPIGFSGAPVKLRTMIRYNVVAE